MGPSLFRLHRRRRRGRSRLADVRPLDRRRIPLHRRGEPGAIHAARLRPSPLSAQARHHRRRAPRPSPSSPGSCFRDTYIFFGILHHIAVASVLGLAFLRVPVALVLGAALFCFAAPPLLAGPAFDNPALIWLGLQSAFPRTNDFVPLFPWFGVVLAGIAAARLWPLYELIVCRCDTSATGSRGSSSGSAGTASSSISCISRSCSALVYLAAQVASAGSSRLRAAISRKLHGVLRRVRRSSPTSADGLAPALAERSQAEGLWSDMMRQTLSADEQQRYIALVDAVPRAAGGGEAFTGGRQVTRRARTCHRRVIGARDGLGQGCAQPDRHRRRDRRWASGSSFTIKVRRNSDAYRNRPFGRVSRPFRRASPSPPSRPWKRIPAWARSTPTPRA